MEKKRIVGMIMFCIAIGAMFILTSCVYAGERENEKSPLNIFRSFHETVYKNDILTAKTYMSKSMLDQTKNRGLEDEKLLAGLVNSLPKELKGIDEKIEGDNAVVTIIEEHKSGQYIIFVNEQPKSVKAEKWSIKMIKEGDEWKIEDLTSESLVE